MTLEDFFTLTEIKDGLTATSRVEELVSAMQRERDSTLKNVGDASGQWAAVAGTIAATNNRDCLDVFVQLDGVHYIDRWLKDAQQLGGDAPDSTIEDSVIALLQALLKLRLDCANSISSGIWSTVENLTNHGCSRIQDLARAIFDNWKQEKVNDHTQHGKNRLQNHENRDNKTLLTEESSKPELPAVDCPVPKKQDSEGIRVAEVGEAESLPVIHSEEGKLGTGEKLEPQTSNTGFCSNMISCTPGKEDITPDAIPLCNMADDVQENASVKENCSMGDAVPPETVSYPHPKQIDVEGPSDAPMSDEICRDEKHVDKHGSFASSSAGPTTAACEAIVGSDKEIKTEALLQKSIVSNEASRHSSEPRSGKDDEVFANNCSNQVITLTPQNSICGSGTSPDSSSKAHRHEKDKNLGRSFYAESGTCKGEKRRSNTKSRVDRRNSSLFSRSATDSMDIGAIGTGSMDIELEYGILDALEVATRVAQEVAREVDSREPSCSSSEKLSGDNNDQPDSPESINRKQDVSDTKSPTEEVLSLENDPPEASHGEQSHLVNSDNSDNQSKNGINKDLESSHVTELAPQQEGNVAKVLCDFDLNQEVCPDDTDLDVTSISTPIPVVSASRPATVSGLPSTPLQFEGTLGWKGSAATSAFRPASPRKISDEANVNNSSEQKQGFLGIDLNVAEVTEDKVEDVMLGKQTVISSNLRSTESSLEVNRGKSERLKLDLNSTDDDDEAPLPSDLRLFLNRNGHQSASPASSSSSMQHSVRSINIDLNDRPQFQIGSSDQGPYHGHSSWITPNPYGGHNKSEEPVISIFGARVEVNGKGFHPPSSSFLSNGKSLEPTMDLNMARTGNPLGLAPNMPYMHSPIYGYHGLTTTPGKSFPSHMYVPGSSIPYMMDPRGATTVLPQVIGSAPPVHPTYPQSPFILNVVGGSTGFNGSGPSKPGFDLNYGFGVEGGNRETMSFRQFLLPGQVRPAEEHLRGNSQPSSSSVLGGKRKEPESGWEPYTLNSRPQPPPWR